MIHSFLGDLGQLFVNLNEPIAIPKGTNKIRVWDNDNQENQVYDTEADEWVTLSQSLYNSIPYTYTFAPQPQNVDMEIDFFARGCGLLKHSFIWSTDSIPKNNFAKIASNVNIAWRGRYTVTPWFPSIHSLGRMMNGYYVMEDTDWQKIYGN